MNKFKKSQALMLSLLVALLIITPLLSSSLSPTTFLYFVINLLIIALGAEAGLLSSAFSKPPPEDKKQHSVLSFAPEEASLVEAKVIAPSSTEKKAKVIEKSATEKNIVSSVVKVDKVKKCPSMPSLFFIGGGETEAEDFEEEEEEEVGGLSGQELCNEAETFIGNFYKQLKMQREDSWKRIHGFYQKAY